MAPGPLHPKDLGHYFALAQVGLEMVAPVGLGLVLDHYLGWTPWGIVGGAIFGLVGGLGHLIVLSNRREKANSPDPQREDA